MKCHYMMMWLMGSVLRVQLRLLGQFFSQTINSHPCATILNVNVVTEEPVPFFSKPVQQLTVFLNVFIIYHMPYC